MRSTFESDIKKNDAAMAKIKNTGSAANAEAVD
jgi:hypothetical protein